MRSNPLGGCVAVDKREYDSAKRKNLLRDRYGTDVTTGRLWQRFLLVLSLIAIADLCIAMSAYDPKRTSGPAQHYLLLRVHLRRRVGGSGARTSAQQIAPRPLAGSASQVEQRHRIGRGVVSPFHHPRALGDPTRDVVGLRQRQHHAMAGVIRRGRPERRNASAMA